MVVPNALAMLLVLVPRLQCKREVVLAVEQHDRVLPLLVSMQNQPHDFYYWPHKSMICIFWAIDWFHICIAGVVDVWFQLYLLVLHCMVCVNENNPWICVSNAKAIGVSWKHKTPKDIRVSRNHNMPYNFRVYITMNYTYILFGQSRMFAP